MATVSTPWISSWGVFAGLEHLFSRLGHGMTILTAGRAPGFLVAADAIKMIGRFEPWFINMVKLGIL